MKINNIFKAQSKETWISTMITLAYLKYLHIYGSPYRLDYSVYHFVGECLFEILYGLGHLGLSCECYEYPFPMSIECFYDFQSFLVMKVQPQVLLYLEEFFHV